MVERVWDEIRNCGVGGVRASYKFMRLMIAARRVKGRDTKTTESITIPSGECKPQMLPHEIWEKSYLRAQV